MVDKQAEYLQLLQERNRIRKNLQSKSKAEEDLSQREKGFSTHFSGANAESAKKESGSVKQGSSSAKKSAPAVLFGDADNLTTPIPSEKKRRWNNVNPPSSILGVNIPISPTIIKENSSLSSVNSDNVMKGAESFGVEASSPKVCVEDIIRKSVKTPKFQPPPLSLRKTSTETGANDDSELRNSLVNQVLNLDENQKKALLKLLQSGTDLHTSSPPPNITASTEGSLLKSEDCFHNEYENDFEESLENHIEPINSPVVSNGVDGSGEDLSSSRLSVETSHVLFPALIRVKLLSTWMKSRSASLTCLLLRPRVPSSDLTNNISGLTVKVSSGFETLPATSEVVRQLPHLFFETNQRKLFPDEKTVWKGPISAEKQLEISFQGELLISRALEHNENPLSEYELVIVNGWGSNSVRAVDIYIKSHCIWSGQLPDTSQLKSRSDLPSLVGEALSNPSWSISITLSSQPKAAEVVKRGSTPASVETKIEQLNNSILLPLKSVPSVGALRAVDMETTSSKLGHSSNESQTPKPIWLAEEGSSVSVFRLDSGSVKKEATTMNKATVADLDLIDTSDRYTISPKAGRRAKRRADLISNSRPAGTPKSLTKSSNRIEQDKITNNELMNSFNALNFSELKNRGRLEFEVGQIKQNESAIPAFQRSLKNADVLPSSELGSIDQIPPSKGVFQSGKLQAKVSARSRITEVSKTVSSALDGISQLLSNISETKSKSNNRFHASPSTVVEDIGICEPDMEIHDEACVPISPEDKNMELVANSSIAEISKDLFRVSLASSLQKINLPTFPCGRTLILDIFTTWGDSYYVGLNGIDLFDENGKWVGMNHPFSKSQELSKQCSITSITANPPDINILPEYENDPRVAKNLVDGVNFTKDDLHMWLAPIGYRDVDMDSSCEGPEPIATITIEFDNDISLSMIRIFNYNKSRTHVQRGVRFCRLTLDGSNIFEGEIQQANGDLTSADECSEVILFTTDSNILKSVAEYDNNAGYYKRDMTDQWIQSKLNQFSKDRPRTGDHSNQSSSQKLSFQPMTCNFDNRPSTSAVGQRSYSLTMEKSLSKPTLALAEAGSNIPSSTAPFLSSSASLGSHLSTVMKDGIECSSIHLFIRSNWGDPHYVGLSGIEFYAIGSLDAIPLLPSQIDAEPRDLRDIGSEEDPRRIENLVNGVSNTTNDVFMWLAPWNTTTAQGGSCSGKTVTTKKNRVSFTFGKKIWWSGLKLWNYNKPDESLLRGVRDFDVFADEKYLGSWCARIAPGLDGVDFSQLLSYQELINPQRSLLPAVSMNDDTAAVRSLSTIKYQTPACKQDFETPLTPSGLLWTIRIGDNWRDEYYVGLDMLEFLDIKGNPIDIDGIGGSIAAVPYGINDILPDAQDSRIARNLIRKSIEGDVSSLGNGMEGLSWIAPISHSMTTQEKAHCVSRVLRTNAPRDQAVLSQFSHYSNNLVSPSSNEIDFEFPDNNTLVVMFPYPVKVSGIRFYNYSKTPSRGVKDFSISVDQKLIYMGELTTCQRELQGILRTPQTILFTNDPKIVRVEKDHISYCGMMEQDVLYINERQVVIRSKDMYNSKPSVAWEGVVADLEKRPSTSMSKT